MKTMGISEFKARCIAILKEVQETREPLTITHRGAPLARIEPIPQPVRLGSLSHLTQIKGDIVSSDDWADEWED